MTLTPNNTPTNDVALTEAMLARLRDQVTKCSDSYEAPSGKIMLRVWVVDQARLLDLAEAARTPSPASQPNCSEDMIEAANARIEMMFAETAILLTHPNAERRALAKDRVFEIMFAAQPHSIDGETK